MDLWPRSARFRMGARARGGVARGAAIRGGAAAEHPRPLANAARWLCAAGTAWACAGYTRRGCAKRPHAKRRRSGLARSLPGAAARRAGGGAGDAWQFFTGAGPNLPAGHVLAAGGRAGLFAAKPAFGFWHAFRARGGTGRGGARDRGQGRARWLVGLDAVVSIAAGMARSLYPKT